MNSSLAAMLWKNLSQWMVQNSRLWYLTEFSLLFINLVVVIERGFVCMAGDLNYFMPWSGFLRFGDNCFSGGMIWNLLSINTDRLCQGLYNAAKFVLAHPGLGIPNFGFRTLNYCQVQRPKRYRIFSGRDLSKFSKSRTGSLRPPSVAHSPWGVFRCFADKPSERVFVGLSLKRTHFANSPPWIWIHTTPKSCA